MVTSRPYEDLMGNKDLNGRLKTSNDEIEKIKELS